MSEEKARPGWYPHPERPAEEWYWDGTDWTASRWAAEPPVDVPSAASRAARRDGHRDRARLRGKFRVAFDGEWQAGFDTLDEAVEWAQDVAGTGRTTWVIEMGGLRSPRLKAAFPEDRAKEAEEEWKRQRHNSLVEVIAASAKGG